MYISYFVNQTLMTSSNLFKVRSRQEGSKVNMLMPMQLPTASTMKKIQQRNPVKRDKLVKMANVLVLTEQLYFIQRALSVQE